jgi:hypothetical protein
MEFRLAFMACPGSWEGVLPEALRHNVKVIGTRCDIHGGTDPRHRSVAGRDPYIQAQPRTGIPRQGRLPSACSMIDLGNERLVLSAVKKCESRDGLLVRFYNPGPEAVSGVLRSDLAIREAFRLALNEAREGGLPVIDGAIPFECRGYEIVTMELAVHI